MAGVSVPVPVVGFLGAGSGLALGTLGAEYVSRVAGQSGWAAVGVKGITRGLIGTAAYVGSTKIKGAKTSFFAEMLAYGDLGGFFLDVALALHPGGIPGLAEDLATTTRVMAAGGKQVVKELSELEQTPGKSAVQTPPVTSSIF